MNHFVKFSLIAALSSASCAIGAEAVSDSAHVAPTAFGKMGPYSVTMSEVSDQGLLLVPRASDSSQADQKWPGLVFAHGLCGPARSYSDSLERLCSWGFVIIANQEQEDCGVMNIRQPLESLGSNAKFKHCADSSIMAGNIKKNLHYLASRSDVNAESLALIGHSMGGGVAIDVAADVNAEHSGLIKAVVGIAPWNGAEPIPSSVVAKIGAPLLLFCSSSDSLCPCSGPATVTDTQGPFTSPAAVGIPLLFGPGADVHWNGGVAAIYRNAVKATLMQVDKASHMTIAGTDGVQMQHLAYQSTRLFGLNFNNPDRPYSMIPTLEYSVAFLYDVLDINRQEGQKVMAAAKSDPRISEVLSK
ncbi:MAG: dienelactone hydrolase family protein [Phycisphaerales bacterium]|nr:dienelactone hydrolase family protein [Phycisphaerales bacterium]